MNHDYLERLNDAINQAEQLALDAQEWSGSTSPWVVEYFPIGQRVTNAAAVLIAETSSGSPLPGHAPLWAPLPEHIAANDPASRLRGIAEDRAVLQRHQQHLNELVLSLECIGCHYAEFWPCPELLGVGRRYGITPEED